MKTKTVEEARDDVCRVMREIERSEKPADPVVALQAFEAWIAAIVREVLAGRMTEGFHPHA